MINKITATISGNDAGNWLSAWISPSVPFQSLAFLAQVDHEPNVVPGPNHEHADADHDQRFAEMPRRCAAFSTDASCSFWNTWKIANPKPISNSDVRITDMSVRSALMRVRCNDIPVRRAESSTEIRSGSDWAVTRDGFGGFDAMTISEDQRSPHPTDAPPTSSSLRVLSTSRSRK